MFSEVKYRFNGAEAEYQLIDNPNLVSCRFENLGWISDQELLGELQRRVPLFEGRVPLSGDLPATVGKQIEAILKERGITATISFLPAASLNGPVSAMAFRHYSESGNRRRRVQRGLGNSGSRFAEGGCASTRY